MNIRVMVRLGWEILLAELSRLLTVIVLPPPPPESHGRRHCSESGFVSLMEAQTLIPCLSLPGASCRVTVDGAPSN